MRLQFRPLGEWPREKTKRPEISPFRATWRDTLMLLEHELEFVIARNHPEVLIQVDAPEAAMRLDGSLRADARVDFHGVMISFESKYGPMSYMCDKYHRPGPARLGDPKWQANVRAIAYGLEALRKLDRYGITDSGQQYTGWKALPSGMPMPAAMTIEVAAQLLFDSAQPEAYEIGSWEALISNPPLINLAWRTASKRFHPDVPGGDKDRFDRIRKARDLLLEPVPV